MATAAAPTLSSQDPVTLRSLPEDSADSLHVRMQKQRIEDKFNQVQKDRRAAHALRVELEQKRSNTKTDEQIMLLMQTDERLAVLLSQAAESMCALLPPGSETLGEPSTSSSALPAHGAKAFEIRAQNWFTILNEVQFTMRSAMRHLREAQLAPLSLPVGSEARATGLAGSAGQGHSLSLMDAFVDMSGSDGATFRLPPAPSHDVRRAMLPALEKSLSIHALREKDRNWKNLSQSLEEVEKSLGSTVSEPTAAPAADSSPSRSASPAKAMFDEPAMVEALRRGAKTDKLLLQALLNANGLTS
ncbi:uncharacterized protein PFL1_03159 [Pseudozyma flocculosa PF-1]|uniref:Mediator of RNA polymerase II transcription subunit 11 n=2 Tax=Pseudozyma flocculosa TaxID=84751 RepID=A0A5C3F2G6_9BASI|nr:uncharacterized protein PFL1_03159 [Pseudozyma flocculosa PF-1]EPQ29404.1 hypothetical protein PFL1_03159 [Pseudozyma flocculosa PF-1]SPO37927.1 uncharacterized protein PSFLO_03404 [Pseudozyma flocculosa]